MAVVSWLSNDNEVTKNKIRDDNIAPIESNALSASKTYTVGKPFVLDSDGKLYKATQQIDQGSAIITSGENANCEEVSNGAEGIFGTKQDIFNLNSAVGNLASRVGIAEGNITTLNEIKANVSDLGTASTKNAISVVTDSSDLVESGAVYDAIGWGNKNLLENTTTSRTLNGLTFTVNNDKSVTVNGTASALTSIITGYIYNKDVGNEIDLFLNGCPAGGASNTYSLWVGIRNADDSGWVKSGRDVGDGFLLDIKDISYSYVRVEIEIASGQTINNLTFYPMISINGGAYEPYHPSVEQTLRDAEVIEGKNLLENTATSQTVEGVTFTVNADKSVTVNGTATNTIIYKIGEVRCSGSYILNGCPNGGSQSTYRLDARNENSAVFVEQYGENASFTYTGTATVCIRIQVGTTVNNLKFYPMVSVNGGKYEPYYTPLKDVVPNKCDNSVIGTVEDGANPTKSYAVGEYMIRGGKFCTVTVPVNTSSTWVEGSNYTTGDVAKLLTYKGEIDVYLAQVSWYQSGGDSYDAVCTTLPDNMELLSITLGTWGSITPNDLQFIPYISSSGKNVCLLSKTNTYSQNAYIKLIYTYKYI